MPTALERIAAYKGKVDPNQVVADCKEVRDQGPAQSKELMRAALTNVQIAGTIAKAKRHLAAILKQQSAETPPTQIETDSIVTAYTQAKTEARTSLAGQGEAEQITVTTRVIAETCAQCHVAALEVLSILDSASIFDDGPTASSTAETGDLTDAAAAAQSIIGQPTEEQ